MRNQRNLAGRPTHSVVGHRTSPRVAVLDDIEPVHRVFRRTDATSRSERPRRRDIAFAAIEKVAVERQDYVGPFNSRNESQIVAKTDLRGEILRFTPQWIVNTPAQAWEHFFQLAANSFARGRMCFFNEKGQPCAVANFPAQVVQI